MPKLTDYEKSVKNTGEINATRVMKQWGNGWERLGREQREDALAKECLMGILGAIDPTVDVQIARDIYKATIKAAGLDDEA